MKKIIIAIVAFVIANSAFAWDGRYQGSTYDGNQAMRSQNARIGVVEDVRRVRIIENDSNSTAGYTGSAIGAGLGGFLGSKIGKGNGQTAAILIATVAGGAMGYSAGNAIARDRYEAVEITVSMRDGSAIVVTQAIDNDVSMMRAGDKVRVIGGEWGGSGTRVARIGSSR